MDGGSCDVNGRRRLGALLIEAGVINEVQLQSALANKGEKEKLGDYLIKGNLLTEQQLIEFLSRQLGVPQIQLSQYEINSEVVQLVPKELAKRAGLVPVRREKNKLFIAMIDPMDFFAIEEVRMATGFQIETSITSKDELYRAITKYYDLQESMAAALEDYNVVGTEQPADEMIENEDSAVIRLVNHIISNGVAQRASDIHFDPQETGMIIRYRIDGVLLNDRTLPKKMQSVVTTRVKIMGQLNITEYRIPQDGRIKSTFNFKPIDIRLSTLPTVYGEKIVMRILDLSNAANDILRLGFSAKNERLFLDMIQRPNGIVLITGPTGSGKSSTLYAGLKELNSNEVNIITVEDPVEYRLEGINQIQVRDEVGMTFAAGLRSILRQDPDIIMLGEIRDLETAQIAIRASLTGHLVLSTLHTNSAVESISRLQDMGIEPFLITSSLIGIVSQRLVRRICRDCGSQEIPTQEERVFLEKIQEFKGTIMKGRGCPVCNYTGYYGRIAIQEVIPINREIKDLILLKSANRIIVDHLRQMGYQSMLDDGVGKVIQGLTTVAEIMKVTIDE